MGLRVGSLAWLREQRAKEHKTLVKRDEHTPVVPPRSTVRVLPRGELWHDASGLGHVLPEDVRAVSRCDCLDKQEAS